MKNNVLGRNLKKLREEAGLKQEELGQKLGVSQRTISNWETNSADPSLDMLVTISKIFDISYEDLLESSL